MVVGPARIREAGREGDLRQKRSPRADKHSVGRGSFVNLARGTMQIDSKTCAIAQGDALNTSETWVCKDGAKGRKTDDRVDAERRIPAATKEGAEAGRRMSR